MLLPIRPEDFHGCMGQVNLDFSGGVLGDTPEQFRQEILADCDRNYKVIQFILPVDVRKATGNYRLNAESG